MKTASSMCLVCTFVMLSGFEKAKGAQREVAFSLQGNEITWFDVLDPSYRGGFTISGAGIGGSFDGNALAYNPVSQQLLFMSGPSAASHALYAIDIGGIGSLLPNVTAGLVATNLGTIYSTTSEFFGATYYNGSYYALENGSDTLRRVVMNPDGTIGAKSNINLPGNNSMNLGDIAFDESGNLWISGYSGAPSSTNQKLWGFNTADGATFTSIGAPLTPPVDRYNGIFYSENQHAFYGYHLADSTYGKLNMTDGSMTVTYTGAPFNAGGDMSNGIMLDVAIPEPSSVSCFAITLGALTFWRRRSKATPVE